MSVKHSLLALLVQGPMHGYQLRAEFERRTGGTWPLNVGQVYSTLTRLERDGLVSGHGEDTEGRLAYEVTEAGRHEVEGWFATPVGREQPPRDELAIKLALAVTVPGVDVAAMVQRQRTATMTALQEYTRLKSRAPDPTTAAAGPGAGDDTEQAQQADLAWTLVLDALVFDAEAEIRWLDHCETRLRRAALRRTTPAAGAGATAPAPETATERSPR